MSRIGDLVRRWPVQVALVLVLLSVSLAGLLFSVNQGRLDAKRDTRRTIAELRENRRVYRDGVRALSDQLRGAGVEPDPQVPATLGSATTVTSAAPGPTSTRRTITTRRAAARTTTTRRPTSTTTTHRPTTSPTTSPPCTLPVAQLCGGTP